MVMKKENPEYLKPALAAGAVSGLLSVIPVIAYLNALCCLWIIAGAIFSAKLLSKQTSSPLRPGDGALVGALTGIIAAIIQMVFAIPSFKNPEAVRRAQELVSRLGLGDAPPMPVDSTGFLLLTVFFFALIYALFGILGGIIGVALFVKKAPPPPETTLPGAPGGPADAA